MSRTRSVIRGLLPILVAMLMLTGAGSMMPRALASDSSGFPTPAEGQSVIWGHVVDAPGGSPINGVVVRALEDDTANVAADDTTGSAAEVEPSGYFELRLPPGTYDLEFDPVDAADRFRLTTIPDQSVAADRGVQYGEVVLSAAEPEEGPTDEPTDGPTEPLTAPVPDAGQSVIWGLVRKAGGYRLLGDVEVQAFPVDGDGEPEATSLTYGGYGYRNGVFALYVAPGTYDLRVTAPEGSQREDLEIGPVSVVADQVAFKGTLKLPYPPGFLVKVSAFDGSRVDGALVQLMDHRGGLLSSGETRAGRIHFGDVPPTGGKRYRLVVTKSGFTESVSRVRYDGTSKKTSVRLRRAPVPEAGSAVIWGVVRSAGDRRFPQNITVQAFEVGGADMAAATSLTYGGYGFRGGVFALHVPPGEYRVTIDAPDGSDRADLELTRSVAADESADLGYLTLPRLPGVSVRAIGLHPRQRIEGATVRMTGPQGEAYEGLTGRDGRVRFAEATTRGYYEIEVSAAGFDTTQSGVSLRRKDRAKRNVYLGRAPMAAPGASVIWGVVRKTGARTTLGNVEVQAVRVDGDGEPEATSLTYGGYGYRNGVFALYVPPGDYQVTVRAPQGSGREDVVLEQAALADTVHNVGFLRLARPPGIRVLVLNNVARGRIDGATVQLTDPEGVVIDGVTTSRGVVDFPDLSLRGHYRVVASRAGFSTASTAVRLKKDRAKTRLFLSPQPIAAPGQSVLWGVVRKSSSRRYVGDALVQAFPAEGGAAVASSLTYEGYGYPNGVYALYVPAGDYTVRVTPPEGTTGEGLELGPVAVEADDVTFLGIRKLPFESVGVLTSPVVTPSSGLVEGDAVSVTPATYNNEVAVASRSFEWFAVYTYDCGQLEDCSYRYQFARGPATEVTLPAFVEGARILVVETARTDKGARLARSQSEPTGVVRGLPELIATTAATFGAIPSQGQPTTPSGVVWNVQPDAISYRWSVDGRPVASSDARLSSGGASFTPAARDVGSWLSVDILATKAGHTPGYSSAYAPRIKGVDERSRLLRVDLTKADGPDLGDADDPVTGASLWLCGRSDCYTMEPRDGGFEAEVPTSQTGLDYQLSVYPFASTLLGTTRTVSVENGDGAKTVAIKLEAVQPAPPAVSFPPSTPTRGEGTESVPMGFIGSPLTPFTASGCTPVDNPTWTVAFASGAEPMTGAVRPGDVSPEGGSGGTVSYTVRIPDLTSSGHATITTNFTCGVPIVFTIYIDPSGYVTDQFGRTIAGAQVTLLRAAPGGGNFTVVADRNAAVMDPAVNDRNPSTTDATGFFRWDVTEGDYRVSVTRASSGGAPCAVVTTPTMSVPPIRVDLLVKTECADASTPIPTTVPAVTGTREVGRVLSVSTATWANGIRQNGIQWLRNGNPIDGATGAQYTLVQADAGQQITARVTAQRPDYVQENGSGATVSFTPFTTPATGGGAVTVPNPGNPGGGGGGGGTPSPTITNTTKPVVSGSAVVGGALAASEGTWSTSGLTFAYQWLRDGSPIEGATTAQYTPGVADLEKSVSVKVTATKTGSTPGTATSDPVTIGKGAAPENLSKPLVTGEPEVGETLTVSEGSWNTEGLAFGYQWLRDGEAIEGATAATYVVTEDDLGSEVTARVTATKVGYEDGTVVASGVTVPDDEEPVIPADSKIKGKVQDRKIPKGTRGELRVRITSLGETVPTGLVEVSVGKKTVSFNLTEADKGVLDVVLPKLKPGKHPIEVTYAGDELTEPSTKSFGKLTVKNKKGKKGKGKDKRIGIGGPIAA